MKAVWVRDGRVLNAVLNEACSSGCGSFVEGTAHSLQSSPEEFSERALFAESPVDLGTKCTVFMASRVRHAQKSGVAVEDIAAGIAHSVVRNALFRIIGLDRLDSLGGCVAVQGGAFVSDAVLRAFELVSGKEAVRPDTAHLMGAIGAALTARERARRHPGRGGRRAQQPCRPRGARPSPADSQQPALRGLRERLPALGGRLRRRAPVRGRQPLRSRARHRRCAPRSDAGRQAPAQCGRARARAARAVLRVGGCGAPRAPARGHRGRPCRVCPDSVLAHGPRGTRVLRRGARRRARGGERGCARRCGHHPLGERLPSGEARARAPVRPRAQRACRRGLHASLREGEEVRRGVRLRGRRGRLRSHSARRNCGARLADAAHRGTCRPCRRCGG